MPVRFGLIAVLLAACSGGPEAPSTFEGCPDLACRQAWLVANFEQDPEAAQARVGSLADPLEREVLALALTEAFPGRTEALCRSLQGPAVQRCQAINSRPHLQLALTELTEPASKAQAPQVFMDRVRDAALPDPWADKAVPTPEIPCLSQPPSTSCATQVAVDAAHERRWEIAVGACRTITDGKWHHECLFQAAEAALQSDGNGPLRVSRVEPAVSLCISSGPYRSRCFQHLTGDISNAVPLASRASPEDWEKLTRLVEAGHDALQPMDPELAQLWRDKIWSQAAWLAYARALRPTGDMLDHVAAAVRPHAVSAIALRLVQLDETNASLGALQEELQGALAARQGQEPPELGADEDPPHRSTWAELLPGEEAIPQLPYLKVALRSTSSDPVIDEVLALVEAAGQVSPPHLGLLRGAVVHEDAQVRWAAVRVLRVVDRGGLVPLPKDDPDPLVRARAQ